MVANDGIIPTNIGLDGKIGGGGRRQVVRRRLRLGLHRRRCRRPADWPTATRTTSGFTGFCNAYLLTGDDRYLDPWRKQIDAINAQGKTIDGKTLYPHMYGDKGWYDFTPEPYRHERAGALLPVDEAGGPRRACRRPAGSTYLDGKNPDYPEQALRARPGARSASAGRRRCARDTTTPDTRLADDPMRVQPGERRRRSIELMLGGLPPRQPRLGRCTAGCATSTRTRRRAGLPEDVAALVETMTDDAATRRRWSTSTRSSRGRVVVQAGRATPSTS